MQTSHIISTRMLKRVSLRPNLGWQGISTQLVLLTVASTMNNGVILFFTLLIAGFYILTCIPMTTPISSPPNQVDHPYIETKGGRPVCLKWHTVGKGETQWVLGKRYSSHNDTWQWIKSMRWISRKSLGDEDLKAGESVCVSWASQV